MLEAWIGGASTESERPGASGHSVWDAIYGVRGTIAIEKTYPLERPLTSDTLECRVSGRKALPYFGDISSLCSL
jgi:hypothetical protein